MRILDLRREYGRMCRINIKKVESFSKEENQKYKINRRIVIMEGRGGEDGGEDYDTKRKGKIKTKRMRMSNRDKN
jgi:hypothetical protein